MHWHSSSTRSEKPEYSIITLPVLNNEILSAFYGLSDTKYFDRPLNALAVYKRTKIRLVYTIKSELIGEVLSKPIFVPPVICTIKI